jgi:hypothetical protein
MQKKQAGGTTRVQRILRFTLVLGLTVALFVGVFPQAFAAFSSDSAQRIIGVGRIQSSTVAQPVSEPETRFAVETLAAKPEVIESNPLAIPLDRTLTDAEKTVAVASDVKRFGEPNAAGWFSTKASAYGPSSAGQWCALGDELTLTSANVGINIGYADLLGRYIYISYGGVTLKVRIVDTGSGGGPDRLFDLQPGVCTAFGAPTPEFGWGVRTIQWRFAD